MKFVAYILFLVTGVFAVFVIVSFFGEDVKNWLSPSQETITLEETADDTTGDDDTTGESQDDGLNAALTEDDTPYLIQNFESRLSAIEESIAQLAEGSAVVTVESPAEDAILLEVPRKIRDNLMQEYTLDPINAGDVFGFYVFGNLPVSTYTTSSARIYVFGDQFHTIRRNLDVLNDQYTFNDTDTFFGRSYFINPAESDGITRFVFEYNGVTMGVEILENEYERFKALLLQ